MTHFMFILKINNTTKVNKSAFTLLHFLHPHMKKFGGWTTYNMLTLTKINLTCIWSLTNVANNYYNLFFSNPVKNRNIININKS